jgi:hypothetical protein
MSRASTRLRLMSKVTLWPRAVSPSASEMPGERWPPVPPQEIRKVLIWNLGLWKGVNVEIRNLGRARPPDGPK